MTEFGACGPPHDPCRQWKPDWRLILMELIPSFLRVQTQQWCYSGNASLLSGLARAVDQMLREKTLVLARLIRKWTTVASTSRLRRACAFAAATFMCRSSVSCQATSYALRLG